LPTPAHRVEPPARNLRKHGGRFASSGQCVFPRSMRAKYGAFLATRDP
jgi:hypothetical protein